VSTRADAQTRGSKVRVLWIVGVAAIVVLAIIGLSIAGSPTPPRPGELAIQKISKIYLSDLGKWIVGVDYMSALPVTDKPSVRKEADYLLIRLSGDLDQAGVDTAVLRVVSVKRWLFITHSSPVAGFKAFRGPDGVWAIKP
jgi:hypothetical protein